MSARDELDKIASKHRGRLTRKIVVNEVRGKPDHPFYHRFEWDDAIAGEEYRLVQAGKLIVEVHEMFEDRSGVKKEIRSYYATQAADSTREYRTLRDIMGDEFRRRLFFQEMDLRVKELVRAYEACEEFWEMLRKELGKRGSPRVKSRKPKRKAG